MGGGKRSGGSIVAAAIGVTLALAAPRWTASVLAAPGALDPTFGDGGTVVTTFGWGGNQSEGRVLLRQRDGRLVVGGAGWNDAYGFALARYDRTGALDPTFGVGGRVVTPMEDSWGAPPTITGLVEQNDGALVAAGTVDTGGGTEIHLVRYAPDGRLDPSFGVGGHVQTMLTGAERAEGLALQPDGAILVVGSTAGATGDDMLLARYRDGQLDPSFGGVGWVSPDLGATAMGRAVLVQADGKIVIAGHTVGADEGQLVLARYLVDGALDPAFGGVGLVVKTVLGGARATAVAQQPDGRLLVAGSARGTSDDFLLARLNADGTLDTAFGVGGAVVTAVSASFDEAFALVLLPDGRIVLAGSGTFPDSRFAATRHRSDGSLDPTFAGGVVTIDFPGGPNFAYGIAAEDAGTIVLAGSASPPGSAISDFALARLSADGALDPTFGEGGRVTTSLASSVDRPTAIALRSDGRILSGGGVSDRDYGGLVLMRHDADGVLDPTFGDGGKVVTRFGNGGTITGLAVQDDVNVIAAATVYEAGSPGFALARYRDDGSLDPTFGTGGFVTTELASGPIEARALLQQRDGKLVVIGSSYDGTSDFALVRYDRDGNLDSTFGNGGLVRTERTGTPYALIEQSDGKLVAVGSAYPFYPSSSSQFMTLARYEPDGRPDTSFGGDGSVFFGSSAIGAHVLTSVVERLDGSLIGVGADSLVAFTASGAPHPMFGLASSVDAPIGHAAALLQPDGAIIGAGYVDTIPATGWTTDIALARYRPNGSLDPTFGDAGVVRTRSLGGSAEIVAVARQADTKIVALARSDADFALVRYFSQDCGNGVVDAGEACDDGNVAAGDCCSPACALEPSGTPCRDAGGACDAPEVCDGVSATCPAAELDPCVTRCPLAPQACRTAERSRVVRTQPTDPDDRRFSWRWLRGASTTMADFGDPSAETDYTLCLYGGAAPALVGEIVVADAARWRSLAGKRWVYADPAATLGLTTIVLQASDRDRTRIIVTGKGAGLPGTATPRDAALTVQLVNGANGLCWGATHPGR